MVILSDVICPSCVGHTSLSCEDKSYMVAHHNGTAS